MVEYKVSDKDIPELETMGEPYKASIHEATTHFYKKLNEAVDKLAADHGVTRDELLEHARKLLNERAENNLRTELKNQTRGDE